MNIDEAYLWHDDLDKRASLQQAAREILAGETHLCRRRCQPGAACECRDELVKCIERDMKCRRAD